MVVFPRVGQAFERHLHLVQVRGPLGLLHGYSHQVAQAPHTPQVPLTDSPSDSYSLQRPVAVNTHMDYGFRLGTD